jgi:hypothetical protein
VVEAAARHGVGRAPQAEDPVHVQEVRQERAVLVPALAGARSAQHGGEARQRRVNVRLFAPQERARHRQRVGQGPRRRRRRRGCCSRRGDEILGYVRWHGGCVVEIVITTGPR